MRADLAARLLRTMKGDHFPKNGVAGVAGVAAVSATCTKLLKLQQLRPLRLETDKVANDAARGVTSYVTAAPGFDDVAIDERKGMAAGGVPEAYLDAWSRLQVQRPAAVSDEAWRLAINDAGLFLDAWGELALEFQWSPADLFAMPRDGKTGGLIWWLRGEAVRSLGPGHAVMASARAFASRDARD